MARWNILRLLVIALMTLMLGLNTQPQRALAAEPANDNPTTPIVVGSLPYTATQSTTEAVANALNPTGANAPTCAATYSHAVWYAYTATFNGAITVDTNGSNPRGSGPATDFQEFQAVYTAANNPPAASTDFTEVPTSCNATDPAPNTTFSKSTFFVKSGTVYYLLFGTVGPDTNPAGNLQVNITPDSLQWDPTYNTVPPAAASQTLNTTEGQTLTNQVVAAFTDTDGRPCGDYTVVVNWGDGTSSTATCGTPATDLSVHCNNIGLNATCKVLGTHVYKELPTSPATVYHITTTVADSGDSTYLGMDPTQPYPDPAGALATNTVDVSVAEAALQHVANGAQVSAVEGTLFTNAYLGTFFDSAANGNCDITDFSASVIWDNAGTPPSNAVTDPTTITSVTDPATVGQIVPSTHNTNPCYFDVLGAQTYKEENGVITPASYAIQTTVTDKDLSSPIVLNDTAVVADAPLTPNVGGVQTIIDEIEGAAFGPVTIGTFTDTDPLCTPGETFGGTINWGDGTPVQTFSPGDGTVTNTGGCNYAVSGSHTYSEEAVQYPITIVAKATGGSVVTINSLAQKVHDAQLAFDSTAPAPTPVEGAPLNHVLLATFKDPAGIGSDPAHPNCDITDYTATIDWGDSAASDHAIPTTTTSTAPGHIAVNSLLTTPTMCYFDVYGTYTYHEAGNYNINIKVTDKGLPGEPNVIQTGTGGNPGDVATTVADAVLANWTPNTFTTTEGTDIGHQLLGTFHDSDPFCNQADYGVVVHWGDGKPDTTYAAGATGVVMSLGKGSCDFAVYGQHVYSEEGGQAPTLTITDEGGSFLANQSFTVAVNDAKITSVGNGLGGTTLLPKTENTAFTADYLGTFQDVTPDACVISDWALASVNASHLVTINWGDGTSTDAAPTDLKPQAGLGMSPPCLFDVYGGHTYAKPGDYTITVNVTDPAATNASNTQWASKVTVQDGAITPVADASQPVTQANPLQVTEGAPFTHKPVATFTDADPGCAASDLTGFIAWGDGGTSKIVGTDGINGDLIAGPGCTFTVRGGHTYTHDGSFPITVTLTDAEGSTSTYTGKAVSTISDTAITPIEQNQNVTALEGKTTGRTYLGEFHDSDPYCNVKDFSIVVNWDKGGTNQTTSLDWTKGGIQDTGEGLCNFAVYGAYNYTEEGTHAIEATVTDNGGAPSITLADTSTSADAPLDSTNLLQPVPAVEGVALNKVVLGTITDHDPNCNPNFYTVAINWGDGSGPDTGAVVPPVGGGCVFQVVGTHTYSEENQHPYPVAVTVNDHGASTSMTDSVAVADAALTPSALLNPAATTEGLPFKDMLLGSVTDAFGTGCNLDNYSVAIRWNDSNYMDTTTGYLVKTTGCTYNVYGNHTFLEEGANNAVVTITDVGGSTAQFTTNWTTADAALTFAAGVIDGKLDPSHTPSEGAPFTDLALGTVTDHDPGCLKSDLSVVSIDWGDGTGTDTTTGKLTQIGTSCNFTVSGSHVYNEDGSYPITLVVKDVGGSTTTTIAGLATVIANVADNGLTTTAAPNFTATEGAPLNSQFLGTFTDSSGVGPDPSHPLCNAADMVGAINWGDGTPAASSGPASVASFVQRKDAGGKLTCTFDVYGSFNYLEESVPGTYPVTVNIADIVGGSKTTLTEAATVNDAVIQGVSNVVSNTCTLLTSCATALPVATFHDKNPTCNTEPTAIATYTATIQWADGLTSSTADATNPARIVQRGGTCIFDVFGTHTYTTPGAKTILTTFSDDGGKSFLTSTADETASVVNVTVPTSTAPIGVNSAKAPATLKATYGHLVTNPKLAYTLNMQVSEYKNITTFNGFFNFGDRTRAMGIPNCVVSTVAAPCHLYVLGFVCSPTPTKTGTLYAKYVTGGLTRYIKVDLSDPDPSKADSILLTLSTGPNGNTAVTSTPPTPPTNAVTISC